MHLLRSLLIVYGLFAILLPPKAIGIELFESTQFSLNNNLPEIFKERSINPEIFQTELKDHTEISVQLDDHLTIDSALLKSYDDPVTQSESWIGSIYGDSHGILVLTKNASGLTGEIRAFDKSYRIRLQNGKAEAGRYTILKNPGRDFTKSDIHIIDQAVHQAAMRPRPLGNPTPVQGLSNPATTIDLMVIYTANAAARSASITTDIANDIAYANSVLDRSCTQTRLRVVHTEQVVYDDSNVTADAALDCIRNRTDGCLDGIETTRNTHGADLIQLWSALPLTDACGIATLYHPTFGDTASYSLKVVDCSADTTIHEIGHNLGLYHDPYQSGVKDSEVTDYSPGYGHVELEAGHRTIMSYSAQCNDFGVSCPRIAYFSNPRILYKGKPLGMAQRRDSAYQIIRNKTSVAAHRSEATAADTPTFSLCEEVASDKDKIIDGCFVATWVFQDENSPEVIKLRIFRDKVLAKNFLGRRLIHSYYALSPFLLKIMDLAPSLRPLFRSGISFLIWSLNL